MKTKIEWCDYAFNPWIGCSKVSAGCANCYAEGIATRFKLAEWGKSADRILSSDKYFQLPLQWDRKAEKNKTRYKVFCASMADVFDEKVPDEWRVKLFRLVRKTNHLNWLILTKRPDAAKKLKQEEETITESDRKAAIDLLDKELSNLESEVVSDLEETDFSGVQL